MGRSRGSRALAPWARGRGDAPGGRAGQWEPAQQGQRGWRAMTGQQGRRGALPRQNGGWPRGASVANSVERPHGRSQRAHSRLCRCHSLQAPPHRGKGKQRARPWAWLRKLIRAHTPPWPHLKHSSLVHVPVARMAVTSSAMLCMMASELSGSAPTHSVGGLGGPQGLSTPTWSPTRAHFTGRKHRTHSFRAWHQAGLTAAM